jgi:hypothetical protein
MCQLRPPSVVATMRCCQRVPAAWKVISVPATQPASAETKLAASASVTPPTFPSGASVAPEFVTRSQGAVPAPQAAQLSMETAADGLSAENGPA